MTDAPSSFPFLKLPAELRWRILLQTDLVTPYGCVEYSGGKLVALHGASLEEPRVERYARNNESEEDAHVNTAPQTTDIDNSWYPDWRSPGALLLVSRAFSGLAQRVLLSENHVEAYGGLSEEAFECLIDNDDGAAWEEALRRDAATCQAAMFVSSAARCKVLASLRSLEVSFPRSHGDRTTPSGAVLQWQKAVQRFSKTLNPRRLIMHIKGDESIPIIKTVFGTHPLVFRQDNLERYDIIDLVRQSVEIYWSLVRLTRLDGVRMFLWDVDWGVEGSKLVYYCRHRSEELPRMAGDMDLFEPLPSPIFHTKKECQRRDGSAASAEHDEQEARQPTSWVEGIFVRPGDEDERWIRYYEEMKALS